MNSVGTYSTIVGLLPRRYRANHTSTVKLPCFLGCNFYKRYLSACCARVFFVVKRLAIAKTCCKITLIPMLCPFAFIDFFPLVCMLHVKINVHGLRYFKKNTESM